jgi:PAS domain S-box-containing protein
MDYKETYRRLKSLIDCSPDVICAFDKEGRFIEVSKASFKVWGYLPKELVGKNYLDFVIEEDRSKTEQAAKEFKKKIEITHFENRYQHKDGSIVPLEWSMKWDSKAGIAYCIGRNIADKKDAEIKLQQTNKRFRSLVQHSFEMIAIIDKEGNYQYKSDSVYHILGYKPEQLLGRNALELVHPDDLPKVEQILGRLYTEAFVKDTPPFRYKTSSGEWVWLEVTGTNLMDDPSVNGVVINARDVTEKIKLQKKLEKEQATRQRQITDAAIQVQERERSQLGNELHDNVNQVLTTIKLYIEMYLTHTVDDRNILHKAVGYVQSCINEIRIISRRLSAPTLGKITLKESLRELVESFNLTNKINIELAIADFPITQELHLAFYRIVQEQLTNIIKHAEASNVKIMIMESYKVVRLVIRDDGKGFNPEIRKDGVGLMSIASRVESLKGQLFIRSAKGKGSVLKVILPYQEKK